MYTQVASAVIPKHPLRHRFTGHDLLFEIVEITGEERQHPSILLEPHRKDYYMLVFVAEGSSRHWVDMIPYTLQPGTFYFSVPHQVHVKEAAKPMKGIMLCFTDAFLAIEEHQFLRQLPLIRNLHSGHELQLNAGHAVFIEDIMRKMLDEYGQKQDWRNSMLLAYLQVLLIYTSRLYTEHFTEKEGLADRALLKRFHALIEKHYLERHDVAAYASLMNISAGHLGDVIRQQSGKTAIEHIHERLLLEARRMLFHTDSAIKEIAFTLGFEDASYFNRFFKRLSDQTPMAYRKATRKMYH